MAGEAARIEPEGPLLAGVVERPANSSRSEERLRATQHLCVDVREDGLAASRRLRAPAERLAHGLLGEIVRDSLPDHEGATLDIEALRGDVRFESPFGEVRAQLRQLKAVFLVSRGVSFTGWHYIPLIRDGMRSRSGSRRPRRSSCDRQQHRLARGIEAQRRVGAVVLRDARRIGKQRVVADALRVGRQVVHGTGSEREVALGQHQRARQPRRPEGIGVDLDAERRAVDRRERNAGGDESARCDFREIEELAADHDGEGA
jgi:hypothetical protein